MGTPTANTSRVLYNETRRYLGCVWQQSTDLDPKPLVDADFNDAEMQKIMHVRRAIDAAYGNAARNYSAFRVAEYTALPTNDFLIGGGDGSAEGAARYWLGGMSLLNVGTIAFSSDVTGSAASPGAATQIHPRATLIKDWVLHDSSANFEVNMLAGRLLTPSIGYPGSAPYTCPSYIIVSNTATVITVSNIDPSTGLPTMAPMTTYDLGVGLNYYRVELSTPAGGDRTDFVLLDAYLDEVDATEDPVLNHNQGPAGAGTTVESARRHQVSQRVFVNESEVGMYVPVVPIIGGMSPGATSVIVSDASKLALLYAAGQLNQVRIGIGRNEELLNVSSVDTGGVERVNFSEPANWQHYDLDALMPSGYVDGDGNRHSVTLLAALNRVNGNSQINTSMIRDYRERHFGSPAELRDMRLDLESSTGSAFSAGEAVAAQIPYITLGLGTSGSMGRVNVSSSSGSVAGAFTAAQALLPDGGVIYVRPGTYLLESTTKIQITRGDITIIGQSAADVIFEGLDEEVISVEANGFGLENLTVKPGDSQYGVTFTAGWDRCHFSKVIFDGDARSDVIVYVTTALANAKFRDCKFTGGVKTTQPYVELDAGSRYLFDSCLFDGVAAQAYLVYLKTTAVNLWFSGCFFSSGQNGLLLNEAASEGIKRVVVDSCIFYDQSTAGLYVAAPLASGYDYSVNDCIFFSMASMAVHIGGGIRVKINSCIIPNSLSIGLNISGAADVSVSDLRIYSTPTGISVANTATVDINGLRVVGTSTQTAIVTANTCTVKVDGGYFSTLLRGIVAGSSTTGVFSDIRMRVIDTAAAQLTGANQILQDITCEDCGSVAVQRQMFSVTGNNCKLYNCRVIDMDAPAAGLGHAFYVSGADAILSNCYASEGVAGSLCRGFSLFGAGIELTDCQVVSMPGFGLYVDAGATGTYQITNFKEESSGTAALTLPIYIAGGEVGINGLQCEGSVRGGLQAIASTRINAAHIYAGAAATNLILLGVGEHTISNSWIDGADNVTNLINSVSSTSLQLSDSTLLNIDDYGVVMTSAGAVYNTLISGCRFIAGANSGNAFISIDANLVAPKITGCRFDGNARNMAFAILSAAVNTVVDSCQIYGLDDEAISLSGDYAFVNNCYIEDAQIGLVISSGAALIGATVQNCTLVSSNSGFILKSQDARIQNCSFLGIAGYALTLSAGTTNTSIDNCLVGRDSGLVPTRGGFSITGDYCSVRNCGFYDLDDAGVAKAVVIVAGDSCQVVGNYIYNCDSTAGGIDITGLYSQVCGNSVYGVNDDNIRLNAGSHNALISDNQLAAATYPAVVGIQAVGCDHCVIEGNRVGGFTGGGIAVDNCDAAHIIGNKVSNCSVAISVATGNYPLIDGNYTYLCTSYGLFTSSNYPSIVGNTFFSCPAANLIQVQVSTATDGLFASNSLWQIAGTPGDANLDVAVIVDPVWAGWKPFEGGAQALVYHNLMNALQNV